MPSQKWDSRSGRAIGNTEDAKSLNKLIETLNLKAYEAKRALVEDNKEVTAQAIKNCLMGIDERRTVLLNCYKMINRAYLINIVATSKLKVMISKLVTR